MRSPMSEIDELKQKIAELKAERGRLYKIIHDEDDEAAARIAELEAERDEMTRRAIDYGAHDAIDAAAREDEREAMLALLDGQPNALASDVAADIRAMAEEPLVSRYATRIAELEAERDSLVAALRPFVDEYSVEAGKGNKPSSDDLRRARAAINRE